MKNIKIIQTSDIHSYLFKTDYVKKVNIGLLRFEKYINKLKEDNEVILIDTGDLFQGSSFSHYISQNIKDFEMHPITQVLNDFGYNIFTLGNHEFNYGFEYLKKCLDKFNGDIVVANIKNINSIIDTQPYKILEIQGLKIAVIGFITAQVPSFEKPGNIKGLEFESMIDIYEMYEQELKDKSDIIIVNYHGGFECALEDNMTYTEKKTGENEGSRLLNKFSSIDIMLTGHQHREICTKINNTQIMQPGVNASFISEITINPKNMLITSKLVSVEDDVEYSNEDVLEVQSKVEDYLDQVLGQTQIDTWIDDLFQARIHSHPLVNFLHEVQLKTTNAQVSAISLFDSAIGFSKEITIRQILANYSYPNTLKVLEVKKEVIKEALEICASYFEIEKGELVISDKFIKPKLQNYQYDMFYGINYEMDIRKPRGQRITKIEFPKGIDQNKIKLVVNNYRATNYSWYPMYENQKVLEETPQDMVEILINYVIKNKVIEIDKTQNFKVIY